MPNGNFLRYTENRFFKSQREIFAEVVASLRARTTTTAPEHFAEAKQVAEDIREVLEVRWIKSTEAALTAYTGVTELVVARPFFTIAQDRVRFAALFETLFCVWIVRIAIGMVLHRKLAIRALDLDFGRGASYTENLVIISFCIRCQGETLLKSLTDSAQLLSKDGALLRI